MTLFYLFFLFLDGSFYLQALSLLLFILCLSPPLYNIALINKLKLIATLNICQVLADFHHRLSRTFGGTIPGGFRRGWSASRLAVVVLVLLLLVVVMVKGSGATTPTSRQRFSIFKPTLPFFAGCHSHRLC